MDGYPLEDSEFIQSARATPLNLTNVHLLHREFTGNIRWHDGPQDPPLSDPQLAGRLTSFFHAVSQKDRRSSICPLRAPRPTIEQLEEHIVNELLEINTGECMEPFPKPSIWHETDHPVYNALGPKREAEAVAATGSRRTDNMMKKRQAPTNDHTPASKQQGQSLNLFWSSMIILRTNFSKGQSGPGVGRINATRAARSIVIVMMPSTPTRATTTRALSLRNQDVSHQHHN